MKLIIEKTGPDGKSILIEKVATGRPDGCVSMTEEVFEEAISEQQLDIEVMKEGKAKIEALLHFADYCVEYGEYSKGYFNYSSALEKTISEGKIIKNTRILQKELIRELYVVILVKTNIYQKSLLVYWKNIESYFNLTMSLNLSSQLSRSKC